MRVVLDTNIIVSALIAPAGKPAAIVDAWPDGKFTLLTCAAISTSCAPPDHALGEGLFPKSFDPVTEMSFCSAGVR